MFKLHDSVVLTVDLPQHALRVGDVGTVIDIPGAGVWLVDFVDGSGRLLAVELLAPAQLRPLQRDEVTVARVKAA